MTHANPPRPMMRSALKQIAWPTVPPDNGPALLALMYQFEQSQWWPAEVLQERQFVQLSTLLEFAYTSVPYYRARYADCGWQIGQPLTPEIFAGLPVLQRADLLDHAGDLLGNGIAEHGKTYQKQTSGSSGRQVEITANEISGLFWSACAMRDHVWHGRDFSGALASIRSGRYVEKPLAVHDVPSWGHPAATLYDTGPMTTFFHRQPIAQQAEILCARNPRYLLAYPSNVLELCDHFRAKGLELPALSEVRTYGEPTSADVRAACREVWGVPARDAYSCEELGYLAIQCPEHEHYHVQSESVILEILDPDGRPCAAGEYGRVVLTALHNFATPLIRYEIGDIAQAGAACPCGRGLPVLESAPGRRRNMARLPDGRCFVPRVSRAVWSGFEPVKRMQMVQRGPGQIEVRLAVTRPLESGHKETLINTVAAALEHPFELVLSELDDVPRHENGKFEPFVCEIPWPEAKAPRFV